MNAIYRFKNKTQNAYSAVRKLFTCAAKITFYLIVFVVLLNIVPFHMLAAAIWLVFILDKLSSI